MKAKPNDRPSAAAGLISYRYHGPYGSVLIGAVDNSDAMHEAARSVSGPLNPADLEVWNGEAWVQAFAS